MSGYLRNELPFYFQVLPSRLPPEQFQSIVAYTLKLCDENDIQTKLAFRILFSISTSHFDNFPRSDYADMPRAANISRTSLVSLTYYHLLSKFGKTNSLYHMRRFLGDSISRFLRYCCKCLALGGSHCLYHQFTSLKYCPEHGIELIDFCPNCQTSKHFFQESFSLVLCSQCGFDLRQSTSRPSSQAEIETARALVIDLKSLLEPNFLCESEGYISHLGQTLADYRRYLRYSTDDILEHLGVRYSVIQAIEAGQLNRANVTFSHYQAYLAALGLGFSQVFGTAI